LIGAAQFGALIQLQTLFTKNQPQTYLTVATLINYGNGTSRWYNQTRVPSQWNFYQLTNSIARVEATYYPTVNEHLITAIDGVRSTIQSYWTLWVFCQPSKAWTASKVGADLLKLTDGKVLGWSYQTPRSTDPSTWQPPEPGAPVVTDCSS
jgi:hypothetical protein